MPRKDFLEDLEAARRPGRHPRLVDVGAGDEDGALCFAYEMDKSQVSRIDLQVFVSGEATWRLSIPTNLS